jgi:hypothetical protein
VKERIHMSDRGLKIILILVLKKNDVLAGA